MRARPAIYRLFFGLMLSRFDAEGVHLATAKLMGLLARVPGMLWVIRRVIGTPESVGRKEGTSIEVDAMGLTFPSPLGVAAGVDKEGTWYRSLLALGFGAAEVGTVTARGQEGNPRPRITRLPRDRALLNAMGFPNPGAPKVGPRLPSPLVDLADGHVGEPERAPCQSPVGVNIGKSKAVDLEHAVQDYRDATRILAPHADYLTLNVSSPNTPGLRDMQTVETLRDLIAGVRAELAEIGFRPPIALKVSPDLANEDLRAIAELALETRIDALIAVNTTVDTSLAAASGRELSNAEHGGGVSGAPLKKRALEVLALLREVVGDRVVLVSVGGIETGRDAWERILSGATLVQAYTGFVYGGPLWPRRVNRELAALLKASGWSSINDAVGRGVGRGVGHQILDS